MGCLSYGAMGGAIFCGLSYGGGGGAMFCGLLVGLGDHCT